VNTVWKYAAKISYQRPGSVDQLDEWSGEITRRVTSVHVSAVGETIFSVDLDMDPAPPLNVWKQPRTEEYILVNGGIKRGGDRIYQWPLTDGGFWKAWSPSDYYWSVQGMNAVVTPFREFENCFMLTLITNPDTTAERFCPGIGFVSRDYWHHGDPQIEHWVLIDFQK